MLSQLLHLCWCLYHSRFPNRPTTGLSCCPCETAHTHTHLQGIELSVANASAEGLAKLGQLGSLASSVHSLKFQGLLQPGFWSPDLWGMLPGLVTFDFGLACCYGLPTVVDAMAACFAAAPRPVTAKGLDQQANLKKLKKALRARLRKLPGCQVQLEGDDGDSAGATAMWRATQTA